MIMAKLNDHLRKPLMVVVAATATITGLAAQDGVAAAAVPSEVTNVLAGYIMTGGTYNEVSATFTVPGLNYGAPAKSNLNVYIFMANNWNCKGGCGYGGFQYVQLGIIESMQSCNSMSEPYNPGTYYDCSFAGTNSTLQAPSVIPKEGDTLSVEISKSGSSSYSLQMSDTSAAGTCSGYGCALWGGTAHIRGGIHAIGWLVQAGGSMPSFGPAIKFNYCKFGPSTTGGSLAKVTMRVDGQNTVVASALTKNSGFSLSYAGG